MLGLYQLVHQPGSSCETDRRYGRLDVLVNNAGIADRADGPPSKTSIGAVRRIFDTNFFGTLAVTQAMLPLLRQISFGTLSIYRAGSGRLLIMAIRHGSSRGPSSWDITARRRQ
jgi:NAD(P)-dependent dehydrogenase (short-subunit alcohol dehydrogenase family)